jgi:DNA-binding IclR family transcriptional regulator
VLAVTGRVSERQRHLLRLLRREPWSTTRELAAYAGAPLAEARRSLDRLRRRGVVRCRADAWALA